jgi:hypothetical protein
MQERMRSGRLTAAGAIGLLLLNFPLLSLFDRQVRVFGVPLLWVYLFVLWAALIALIAYVVREAD